MVKWCGVSSGEKQRNCRVQSGILRNSLAIYTHEWQNDCCTETILCSARYRVISRALAIVVPLRGINANFSHTGIFFTKHDKWNSMRGKRWHELSAIHCCIIIETVFFFQIDRKAAKLTHC
jgi:hypothetical protein